MSEPVDAATVFVLSPANLSGVRGGRIVESRAEAPFMSTLRTGGAVPLGDVYAFISSLYCRGKRSYGRAFGRRPGGKPSALVVTPRRGLVPDEEPVTLADLRATWTGPTPPTSIPPGLRGTR